MTSQVVFKVDQKLKRQAMKKAGDEGMSLSTILKLATQAYVNGNLEVGLIAQPRLNARTRRELIKTSRDIKEGKNLSPAFRSAKEMIAHLNK